MIGSGRRFGDSAGIMDAGEGFRSARAFQRRWEACDQPRRYAKALMHCNSIGAARDLKGGQTVDGRELRK